LLTDRAYLTSVQYRTDANLAARQSIYKFQHPLVDLPAVVLDLARLAGTETVADIGCGNGRYPAELARRGHGGQVLGVDLSTGMLAAARAAAAAAQVGAAAAGLAAASPVGLAAGDAAALPLADGTADVTLAMHMLYHAADRPAVARELRRITRSGGLVLVVLNGADHLRELRDLVGPAAREVGLTAGATDAELPGSGLGMDLDAGAELLSGIFGSVERHDFPGDLVVPGPELVLNYVRSMRLTQSLADPESLVTAVARRIPAGGDGSIRIGPARAAWSAGCGDRLLACAGRPHRAHPGQHRRRVSPLTGGPGRARSPARLPAGCALGARSSFRP
jgi:SAM-dependent methyltransferase